MSQLESLSNPLRSYLLVLVQFCCLVGLVFTGPWIAHRVEYLMLEAGGILLRVWVLWTMRLSRLHILPDVTAGSSLVTDGPYRFIRHPMYTAVLLVFLALVLNSFTWWRGVLWIVLLVDLVMKLTYEEHLLVQQFKEYRDYQNQTKRLVPGVY